jgi:hypothetical protein
LLFKSTTEKLDPPQTGETPQQRRIGCSIDAAFEPRTSRRHLFVRERQHLHQDDTRNFARGERSSLLSARPARTRPPGLRQRLVDLNLALHAAPSRFWFFETADLPPEQDFLQGQETGRAFVRTKRLIVKSQCDCDRH